MTTPPPLPASIELLSRTYRSTRAANWRCNLYTMCHNKQLVLVFGACSLLLSFTIPLPALSSNALANMALRLAVTAAGMGLLNFAVLALAILNRLPTAKTVRICTSSLTAEGVRDVTPEKSRLLSWGSITQISEHNGDVHVWSGMTGIFVPRDAFKDLDEARRFTQLSVELWHSKGSSWPEVSARC